MMTGFVGGGATTDDVVIGASGLVVDGAVCGAVPPGTVDNIATTTSTL